MSKTQPGTVYLVGAGPGNPGLLTVRAAELLAGANVVVHDALVPPALLRLVSATAVLVDAGKHDGSTHSDQAELQTLLIEHARAGRTVVRLKGGDPYVFGHGAEEAAALREAGIAFEVVPGVSSFSAAISLAGIPLTHRGLASAFTVIDNHENPDAPDAAIDWARIARLHGTKVLLIAIDRLPAVTAALVDAGLPASTPAAIVPRYSTGTRSTLEAPLGEIAQRAQAAAVASPAVVVIGEVVSLRPHLNWFEKLPLAGRRVAVPCILDQRTELGRHLAEAGADVLEIPTRRLAPPARREPMIEAIAGLGEYHWAVFTGVPAVNAFFDALLAAFEDIRAVGNLRLAAFGAATLDRLRELHLRVDAQLTDLSGPAVATAIGEVETIENLKILVPGAEGSDAPEFTQELETQGAIVDSVGVYQTIPDTSDAAGLVEDLRHHGADWIALPNSAATQALHQRVDLPRLAAQHPHLRFASIGPETTRSLATLHLPAATEADPHTLPALVESIVAATLETPAAGH